MKTLTTILSLSAFLVLGSANAYESEQHSGKQLCYVAANDIDAHEFMKKASFYLQGLESAIKQHQNVCFDIKTGAQLEEAELLVSMDATQSTLVIK